MINLSEEKFENEVYEFGWFAEDNMAYYNFDFMFDMSTGLTEPVQIESRDRAFDNCLIFVQSSYFNY